MFPMQTQDQTAGLYTNALCSTSLDPFAPREFMFTTDFQVTWSKVKIKLLIFVQKLSAQYLLSTFLKLPNIGTVVVPGE